MALSATKKTSVIKDYQRSETDSGSPEIQIALLTERINQLTTHLKANKKDHSSRRGLLMMVSKRNRLLKYLSGTNHDAYLKLIKRLELRK